MTDMVQVTIDNEWEVIRGLRLVYLHLTFSHSKVQGQGNAHFYNEYLGNGNI